jgi:putative two-component system response regulator
MVEEPAGGPAPTAGDLSVVGRLMATMRGRCGEETVRHSRRVAAVSALLADRLAMCREDVWLIWVASHLHDVGKLEVGGGVLGAPRALTPSERAAVERHALAGSRLLSWRSSSPLFRMAASIAETHHERYDGNGYPHGLAGRDIPLGGRLVAVADVFDALLSDRPYRPALDLPDAADVLVAGKGSHFDPDVVEALFADLPEALMIRSTVGEPPSDTAQHPPAPVLVGALA